MKDISGREKHKCEGPKRWRSVFDMHGSSRGGQHGKEVGNDQSTIQIQLRSLRITWCRPYGKCNGKLLGLRL